MFPRATLPNGLLGLREDPLHYRIGVFAVAFTLRITRARVSPMHDSAAAHDVNGKDAEPLEQTGERHGVRRVSLGSITGKTGYQSASPDSHDACCPS